MRGNAEGATAAAEPAPRFNISTKNKTESAQEFGRYLSLDLS